MRISPRQLRAARALLGWSRADLADKSIVSPTTIGDIERNEVDPRAGSIDRIVEALESAGVELLHADSEGIGEGVRLVRKLAEMSAGKKAGG